MRWLADICKGKRKCKHCHEDGYHAGVLDYLGYIFIICICLLAILSPP